MAYRVKAPYVTLKVRGDNGQIQIQGFYRGAVVPDDVDKANLKKHLESDMVERVSAATVKAASPKPPKAPAKKAATEPDKESPKADADNGAA